MWAAGLLSPSSRDLQPNKQLDFLHHHWFLEGLHFQRGLEGTKGQGIRGGAELVIYAHPEHWSPGNLV